MPSEPTVKRVVAFIDGQNLFHRVRDAFGYTSPNFDAVALADAVAKSQEWQLIETRFYTGVPDEADDAFWHHFWSKKLLGMSRQGAHVFSRALRYRNKRIRLPNGIEHTYLSAEEKGIDVRIAIDVICLAHRNQYDVALIFSQDQDLSEAVDEVRVISREQSRWIKVACAFPDSLAASNRRGVNGTDWIKIDRTLYDACLDPRDYRPKKKSEP